MQYIVSMNRDKSDLLLRRPDTGVNVYDTHALVLTLLRVCAAALRLRTECQTGALCSMSSLGNKPSDVLQLQCCSPFPI